MHVIFKIIAVIPTVVYYTVVAIILTLVPYRFRRKDVSEEIVAITGGGSGIGRELGKRFASLGARVVLLDISVPGLNETASLIENASLVHTYKCDVTNRAEVYSIAARIKDEVGTVTMLINNAGIVIGKKFIDTPDELIQKTMDVNAMSHFWTCKAFLPGMIAMNKGHIVCIASFGGFVGVRMMADYCSSKFAAVGFEESLRIELSHDKLKIKTTVVAPYFVNTGLFEGTRLSIMSQLTPKRVADAIVSGVLANQEIVIIPGGLRLLLFLRELLPRRALRAIYEASEANIIMDTFTGRVDANKVNDKENNYITRF